MNGTKTATTLIKDGAMPYMNSSRIHTQHLSHAEGHRKQNKRKNKRIKRQRSSSESAEEARVELLRELPMLYSCNNRSTRTAPSHQHALHTATAVFPWQHTVLSALTERTHLERNPTYVRVHTCHGFPLPLCRQPTDQGGGALHARQE